MPARANKLKQLFFPLFIAGLLQTGFHSTTSAQSLTLYTPYTRIAVPPGQSIDYSIDVINNSKVVGNADIAIAGLPKDWTYEIKSGGWNVSRISVLPGERKNFSLQVQVPLKINKGTYGFQVLAKGLGQLPISVVVSEQGTFKTEFSTGQANMEGAANATFTYNATLRNRTADAQVYALRAYAPPGWNVAFKANYKQVSSVSVEANKTQDITIEVDPPDQLKAGKYKIPIQAATEATSANLELEAGITGSYAMELTTPQGLLSTDITAGDDKKVELLVRNTGSADLANIDLQSAAPANWTVTFEPKKVDRLPAGATAQVVATIKADKKAIAGDYVTNMEAKTPEVSSRAAFRVSVETSMIWGWMGILIILVALGSVYRLFRKYGRR